MSWIWLLALAAQAAPLDVNQSSAAALAAIPGIGPDQAAAIVEWRVQRGPFERLSDVAQVPGVGVASVATLHGRAVAKRVPDAAPIPEPAPLDLNTATSAELATLAGVGPREATSIVAERMANGRFTACADVTRVAGIGPATAALIAPRCVTP